MFTAFAKEGRKDIFNLERWKCYHDTLLALRDRGRLAWGEPFASHDFTWQSNEHQQKTSELEQVC